MCVKVFLLEVVRNVSSHWTFQYVKQGLVCTSELNSLHYVRIEVQHSLIPS